MVSSFSLSSSSDQKWGSLLLFFVPNKNHHTTPLSHWKNKQTQTSGNRRTVSSVHISTVPIPGVKVGTLTTIITIRNRMPNRDVLDG